MKLAEALVLRADAQKRFEQLQERIIRNAKVQAGDTPAEDPTGLLSELEQAAVEMTGLIQKINRTNSYHFAMKSSHYGKAKLLKKLYFPDP